MKKIDRIIVQVIVSEFDEGGTLVDEQSSQPVPFYRGRHQDIWAFLDKELENGNRPNPS